jgi:hypothetical protein
VGFDASKAVSPLDWDFTEFGQGKGRVPEPTDKMIETALRDLAKASAEMIEKAGLKRDPNLTQDQIAEILAAFPDDFEATAFAAMSKKMITIFAKLCGNQPSATILTALPFRVRQLFFLWLMKELRPEADGGATTRPPLSLVRNG